MSTGDDISETGTRDGGEADQLRAADAASVDCFVPCIREVGPRDDSWKHYPNTILCFEEPRFEVDLRQPVSRDDTELLRSLFAGEPFCVITPDNPYGSLATDEANRKQRTKVGRVIEVLEARSVGCQGRSPNRLHGESGWAIAVPREVGRYLAVKFGQSAFFYYDARRFWLEPAASLAEHCPLPTPDHLLPQPPGW